MVHLVAPPAARRCILFVILRLSPLVCHYLYSLCSRSLALGLQIMATQDPSTNTKSDIIPVKSNDNYEPILFFVCVCFVKKNIYCKL